MNYQELRVNHTLFMEKIASLNGFIEDHFSQSKRADIKVLARRLRVKIVEVPKLVLHWTQLRRGNGEKQLHKLCVFYSERHTKPNWFSQLDLTSDDYSNIIQASRRLDLPTLSHIAGLSTLLDDVEDGWTDLCEQVSTCREAILGKLFDHGYVPDGSKFSQSVRGHDLRVPRITRGNQNIDNFGAVKVVFGWGYLAFDRLDQLLEKPNTADDFFIMKPRNGIIDNPEVRRDAQNRIRALIKDIIDEGYLFASVITSAMRSVESADAKHIYIESPVLIFTNKNELGVVVKVTLNEYAGLGNFVLDR